MVFGKVFSQFLSEAAIKKLASSKSFQDLAVKAVDGQKAIERLAQEAAKDPSKAKAVVAETSSEFWVHFKKEFSKQFGLEGSAAQKNLPSK